MANATTGKQLDLIARRRRRIRAVRKHADECMACLERASAKRPSDYPLYHAGYMRDAARASEKAFAIAREWHCK